MKTQFPGSWAHRAASLFLFVAFIFSGALSAQAQILPIDGFESAGPPAPDANGIIGDPLNTFAGNAGEWVTAFSRAAAMVTLEVNSNPLYVTAGTKSLRINQVGDSGAGAATHFNDSAASLGNNPVTVGPWFDELRARFANYQTVGANPGNWDLKIDFVIDPTLIPAAIPAQEDSEFLQIGVLSNSGGIFQRANLANSVVFLDNGEIEALRTAGVPATYTLVAPASEMRFDFVTPPVAHGIGFSINGWWGVGSTLSIFADNIRFENRNPITAADLNGDLVLNRLDWGIFIANHYSPTATTLAQGDVDGDGDNDFDDFTRFEEIWDANSVVPFASMLAGVPEPSSIIIVTLGALVVGLNRRVRRTLATPLLVLLALGISLGQMASPAHAVLETFTLYNFENGLNPPDNFEVSGDAIAGSSVAASSIGATNGTGSMAMNTPLSGFNWVATNDMFGDDPAYGFMNQALDKGAQYFDLRMDLTFRPGDFTGGEFATFANASLRIQNSNDPLTVTDPGLSYDFVGTQTLTFSQPLTAWGLPAQGGVAGFYRFDIGVNGDWDLGPGIVHVDNIRLVQTAEVPLLKLRVNTATGATTLVNQSGSAISMNYYEITSEADAASADFDGDTDIDGRDFLLWQRGGSPNPFSAGDLALWQDQYGGGGGGGGEGSLNRPAWNSLDDQNLDIFDGVDPDLIPGSNPVEGWAEAGGSGSTRLTEAFLVGQSTIANAAPPISLGNIFTVGSDQNLVFRYREPARNGFLRTGIVEYFSPLGALSVPEPSSLLLGSLGLAVLSLRRRHKQG
ncbi:MAG: PEP-CTERM sorting domain-containing protein [Bythopirellula sp.]|nr:PEP-CTERM sorting domain-containing protein [Bythopirellula sp.]